MTPQPPQANAAQFDLWNGRGGEIWTRLQVRLDALFEPLTAALLSAVAIEPGESIVEIGCGCGDLTLLAAQAASQSGHIFAIDISTRMLERAKSREYECRAISSLAPIQWHESDAMLYPFEPHADLAISRFGVMFFADPVQAFRNIKQCLKPDGRLAVLCWAPLAENDWIQIPLDAVQTLIEPLPSLPPGSPGPFAFADPARVINILNEAGFSNASAQLVECKLILGRASDANNMIQSAVDDALVLALESGPVAALLRAADEALHCEVREAIGRALKIHYNPDERNIAFKAKCWLFQNLPRHPPA
jgi:SAM-dependent methyltransferase